MIVKAKEVLRKIYEVESNMLANNELSHKHTKSNSIAPINTDYSKTKELKHLWDCFSEHVRDILDIRSEYYKLTDIKISQNSEGVAEIVNEESRDISEYVKTSKEEKDNFNLIVELKKPHLKLITAIILISVIAFLVMTCIATSYHYAEYIGPWIVISRS